VCIQVYIQHYSTIFATFFLWGRHGFQSISSFCLSSKCYFFVRNMHLKLFCVQPTSPWLVVCDASALHINREMRQAISNVALVCSCQSYVGDLRCVSLVLDLCTLVQEHESVQPCVEFCINKLVATAAILQSGMRGFVFKRSVSSFKIVTLSDTNGLQF
jgi:hypothetical protein